MASAIITGEVRVSNQGNVFTKAFSAMTTVSVWQVQQVNLAAGVSDWIVSLANQSAAQALVLMATSVCRVNFSGKDWGSAVSSLSAGSAGLQFRDLFAIMGSGMSGIVGLHFANSTADSYVVTVLTGQ